MTSSPLETETLVEVGYQTFPKQKHRKVMQEKGSTSRNSVQICHVDYIIQQKRRKLLESGCAI